MAALTDQQFRANIKPRTVLYFPDEAILKTPNSHYFICLGKNSDGHLMFSCCTSQFDTVRQLVERNRWPQSTLVYIPGNDTENPFRTDTYVNCNEFFEYSLNELWSMYLDGILSFKGDLPLHSFEQILIGLSDSPQIEDIIKEELPTIDDVL